jgi:hypothetical protein
MTLISVVTRRLLPVLAVAFAFAVAVPSGIAAGPALWTLTSAQPSFALVGTKGFQKFRIVMTPPNTAAGTPMGFMTVRTSPAADPIWCFPDTGTLCYMSYGGSNAIDVHIYMSNLAKSPGTMRLQLQAPDSSQSPVYYSTVLTIPIVAKGSGGAHGGVIPSIGPIQKLTLPPTFAKPAPRKT